MARCEVCGNDAGYPYSVCEACRKARDEQPDLRPAAPLLQAATVGAPTVPKDLPLPVIVALKTLSLWSVYFCYGVRSRPLSIGSSASLVPFRKCCCWLRSSIVTSGCIAHEAARMRRLCFGAALLLPSA